MRNTLSAATMSLYHDPEAFMGRIESQLTIRGGLRCRVLSVCSILGQGGGDGGEW